MGGSGTGTPTPEANIALTISDLRDYLWDLTADNDLLNDQEFSTSMLEKAREAVIEQWNATPPQRYTYELTTFPDKYVYYWRIGAAAEALRMKAMNYMRNQMDYSAGGVTISDNNKAESYLTVSEMLRKQWEQWMHREKLRKSLQDSFFILDSNIKY